MSDFSLKTSFIKNVIASPQNTYNLSFKSNISSKDTFVKTSIEKPCSDMSTLLDDFDDGVMGYDIVGDEIREDIRTHIFSNSGLNDTDYTIRSPKAVYVVSQLPPSSKYFEIGLEKTNKKDDSKFFIFENLRQAPDNNGVRGKTPLSGDLSKLNWRIGKAKDAGIKRIIDLRSQGECSDNALHVLSSLGVEYINFPVEDEQWTEESLDKITEFFNAINKGDFYVGCANGEARTDTAIALNYVLNPFAENLPELYFGSPSSTRVSVRKNIALILDLLAENPQTVIDWGWKSYDDFRANSGKRFLKLNESLKK